MCEVAEDLRAMRRVHDFDMELRGVELLLAIDDRRHRRAWRFGNHFEAGRHFSDMVAMAHPDLLFFAILEQAFEQFVITDFFNECAAKLAAGAAFNTAT